MILDLQRSLGNSMLNLGHGIFQVITLSPERAERVEGSKGKGKTWQKEKI